MVKVSIIVPVYNVEIYIKKCLDTLVNQTLEDIEIIIVNDGSTDNSEQIIKQYLLEYKNKIKYLVKENGGLSDARNYGMKYATGEYIAFLDSDDYIDISLYEKMYNKAKERNYDYIECDFVWKYDDKEVQDIGVIYKNKKEMFVNARVVAWNKLIKRELIVKSKVEFPKGLRYEDVEFFYKLLPYIKTFSFVKEPLIYYVQRKDSIANTQNEKTKEIIIVLDNVIKYYKQQGIFNDFISEIEYNYARYLLCSSLLRIVKIKDEKIRKELLIYSWNKLNRNFPNWKKNRYLKEIKSKKNLYMKTVNKYTYKIYIFILRIYKHLIN